MFEQIKLAYGFDALEPFIDTLTMETHYGKHHALYTKNLNAALENLHGFREKSIEEILGQLEQIPDEYRIAVRNNGGGYYNHNLYFAQLTPNAGGMPKGDLLTNINDTFGSFDAFKSQLSAAAAGQFGSGWAWLVQKNGNLYITTSANQDNPLMTNEGNILLALDVWEHAYYLKYKNMRADYIKAFLQVVDWDVVGNRLA